MREKIVGLGLCVMLSMQWAGRSHYALSSVSRTRLLVDNRYDASPDVAAMDFLAPYKRQVDSVMCPVVGKVACDMSAGRPEDKLSNLLPDILIWGSKSFGEHPDFSVYNIGGMRASLAKGDVTFGDIVDVAPFENKIYFLTLSGGKVLELFSQIAMRGGEGVSHGVNLVITKDGKLVSAAVNGKPIDPAAKYRVVTLDYVAEGNDQMVAFKSRTDVVSPQSAENNLRYIIRDYFLEQSAKGEVVTSQVEGRIVVQP